MSSGPREDCTGDSPMKLAQIKSHQFTPTRCKNLPFSPCPITVTLEIPALAPLLALPLLPPSGCPALGPVLRKAALPAG